ncbi:MAG: rod shape-determining protein RodA [Bacteroidetes bacterium]|nr:rod shape-determining protein RodA [Bacteroidota bacterium]
MREDRGIFKKTDRWLVIIYIALVLIGWINIYAAVYSEEHKSIFDLGQNYGRQMIWIVTSLIIALIILLFDSKFFSAFSFPVYLMSILTLIIVLIVGKVVAGSRSWFQIGPVGFQPAEFAKFAVCLALARYLSSLDLDIRKVRTRLFALLIIIVPALLVLLEQDTGSAITYSAFLLVFYREGMPGRLLLIGAAGALLFVLTLLIDKFILVGLLIGVTLFLIVFIRRNRRRIILITGSLVLAIVIVFSVDYAFNHLLKPYQQSRVSVMLGKEIDTKGAGYNLNQSKIAIGSGGLVGKGFLNGTQTKFDFVPEQSTDFIFCTVGEEWGFIGSLVVIGLYIVLLIRIIQLAERQRSIFSRIYGYGVASILFFHFAINIGMTIGLAPVIGIPLPFLSYGGSSLWVFTILLFIFIKLDTNRMDLI